jgi:hypothetical protein
MLSMHKISSNIHCPSCNGQLRPKILVCENCDLTVEGPFQFNEFATLAAEDLHFLRIFIQSEGRIRDMEPALGLSYPTIRSRLAELKTNSATSCSKMKNPKAKVTRKKRWNFWSQAKLHTNKH